MKTKINSILYFQIWGHHYIFEYSQAIVFMQAYVVLVLFFADFIQHKNAYQIANFRTVLCSRSEKSWRIIHVLNVHHSDATSI